MKKLKLNKRFSKALAVLLAVITLFSATAAITVGVAADESGDWDYKAYIPDENLVYPTQSIISNSWGWPATVTETEEYLEFKYNQAVPYQYTAGISEISFDGAHIKLAVENASSFYIGFGSRQQHPGSNNEIAFKLDKSADTFAVTIGSQIEVLQNFTYADDNLLDIKLEKTDSGYKFIFDGSFTYTLTNELLNSKTNLKNTFNTSKVWFNISPNTNTPVFRIYSVHGGDKICYDELSESHTAEEMNSIFEVITAINAIDSSITADSKTGIEAARAAYDALDEDLKQYVSNYDNLTYAESAYDAKMKADANIDGVLYEATVNQVGPNHHWPTSTVDWFEAESGEGVTINFNNTHWHNVGLTSNNKKALDGLHIRLGKGTYEGNTGENFGLIFDQSLQIQMSGQQKDFCLAFNVKSTGVKISYGVDDGAKTTFIDTALIKKADFENGWDIRFDKQENGDYLVTLNNAISGIIPKDVIDAAVAKGLDTDNLNVTLAGNTAAPSGKLYVDFLSIHDGSQKCSDELYDEYGADALTALGDAVEKINAVTMPITLESGLAIMTAEAAYEAVDEELRQYITKYDDLVTKRKLYDRLNSDNINMDIELYPSNMEEVGPTQYWSTDTVDWYEAESGEGVTIKFNNTTVHRVGLNVSTSHELDGLHMHFKNSTFTGQGEKFALMIDTAAQVSHDMATKKLWFFMTVKDSYVSVDVQAAGEEIQNIINTTYITKADMQAEWDFEITKNSDGSYTFTLCGVVDGIIPESYIASAKESGLTIDAVKVTLAAYNYGAAAGLLQMDYVACHGGEATCYCSVPEGDVLATQKCVRLIDAIGTVDKNSGARVKAAQDAFDALGEYLQGLVTNAETLRTKAREYSLIATDMATAAKVDTLISKLSATITDSNYDAYLTAYFEYLDLFPRVRQYMSYEKQLLKAVEKYESEHEGVNLSNECMNAYTNGRMAHYLSGNAGKTNNGDSSSPLTGRDRDNLMTLFSVISLFSATAFLFVVCKFWVNDKKVKEQ